MLDFFEARSEPPPSDLRLLPLLTVRPERPECELTDACWKKGGKDDDGGGGNEGDDAVKDDANGGTNDDGNGGGKVDANDGAVDEEVDRENAAGVGAPIDGTIYEEVDGESTGMGAPTDDVIEVEGANMGA